MTAFILSRSAQLIVCVGVLAATAAVIMASATPVRAFSCDDVRGLTRVEQNYWSKQLNLTADQRHRIWVECYGTLGTARVIETNGNGFQPLPGGDR
jgi:hypothetical protein